MNKVKKSIRYFLFAVVIIYVFALFISWIKVSSMTYICHKSTGWGVVLCEIGIDFTQDIAYKNHYAYDGTETQSNQYQISSEQEDKIKKVLTFSLFPLWRKFYSNPNVSDGDQWTIESDVGTTHGSNGYPLTYQFVFDAINDLCI